MRRLVIDDLRTFPDLDAECYADRPTYALTTRAGLRCVFDSYGWDEVYLDHDLGYDTQGNEMTIRPVVAAIEAAYHQGYRIPVGKFIIVTDNSVGRAWIEASLQSMHYEYDRYCTLRWRIREGARP